MRRVIPVIAVVVVLAGAGCSGGTEEVSRESTERSGAAANDDRTSTADPDSTSTSAPSDADDQSGEADQDATSGDDATGGGSTASGPGRTGSPGSANSTGSSGTAEGGDTTGDRNAPSGGGTTPATTAPAPFRPAPDRYDTYVGLARQYGGDVAGREDAAALATLLCSDPATARAEFLGGEPLGAYPSDLAIVRAYCPDKEPLF